MNTTAPVILFVALFMAAIAHHLWRRHDRLLAIVPAAIAFELITHNFPVVATLFHRLEAAVGVTTPMLLSLASSFLVLFVIAFAVKRIFAPPR